MRLWYSFKRFILTLLLELFPSTYDWVKTKQALCPECNYTKTSVVHVKCSDCMLADYGVRYSEEEY